MAARSLYFWRIEALKNELRNGPLAAGSSFAYVVATLLLYTLATVTPGLSSASPATAVDWLTSGLMLLFVGIGSYAAYRANGGLGGSDFAARYFALGWVLFIRLAVLLFLPALAVIFVLGGALWAFEVEGDRMDRVFGWAGAAFGLAFEIAYYSRLTHHFREIVVSGAR